MLLYGSTLPDKPTFAPTFAGEQDKAAAASSLWDATRDLAIYRDNSNAEDNATAEAYDRRNKAIFDATGVQLTNPRREFTSQDLQAAARMQDAGQDPLSVLGDLEAEWQAKAKQLARDRPDAAAIIGADRPITEDAYAISRGAEAAFGQAEAAAGTAGVGGLRKFGNELAGGLSGGLRDPMQIATLFIGGGLASPAKSLIWRAGETILTEAALNAGVEADLQAASHDYKVKAGLDASLPTALSQVGFAALFGGGFGGLIEGGRALFGLLGREAPPALERVASGEAQPGDTKALADALGVEISPDMQAAADRAVEEMQLDHAAFGPPPAGLAPEEAQALAGNAVRLAEEQAPVLPPGFRDAADRHDQIERIVKKQFPVGKRPPQPQSLLEFLAANGGVRDDAGELVSRDAHKWRKPGYGSLVTEDGIPLDRAREAAEEAGYIGRPGDYQVATIDELTAAIDNELAGKPVYSRQDDRLWSINEAYDDAVRGRDAYRRMVEEVDSAVSELGVGHAMDDSLLIRATELMGDDGDATTAVERALDEEYRRQDEALAGGEDGRQGDSDIPFFGPEDTGPGADSGRPAGRQGGDAAAGGGRADAAAGLELPGFGANEGTPGESLVPPGPAAEPATPEAVEISATALREAGGEQQAKPEEVTSVWDALPAAVQTDGTVLHATYQTMIEDAERSDFYAGIVASCRD